MAPGPVIEEGGRGGKSASSYRNMGSQISEVFSVSVQRSYSAVRACRCLRLPHDVNTALRASQRLLRRF